MPIEIMDVDASEIPEAPSAPVSPRAPGNNRDIRRRLEQELRLREERIVRRLAC